MAVRINQPITSSSSSLAGALADCFEHAGLFLGAGRGSFGESERGNAVEEAVGAETCGAIGGDERP